LHPTSERIGGGAFGVFRAGGLAGAKVGLQFGGEVGSDGTVMNVCEEGRGTPVRTQKRRQKRCWGSFLRAEKKGEKPRPGGEREGSLVLRRSFPMEWLVENSRDTKRLKNELCLKSGKGHACKFQGRAKIGFNGVSGGGSVDSII